MGENQGISHVFVIFLSVSVIFATLSTPHSQRLLRPTAETRAPSDPDASKTSPPFGGPAAKGLRFGTSKSILVKKGGRARGSHAHLKSVKPGSCLCVGGVSRDSHQNPLYFMEIHQNPLYFDEIQRIFFKKSEKIFFLQKRPKIQKNYF